MPIKNQKAIPVILEAILGHPERYSPEQVSSLHKNLTLLRQEMTKEEELMNNMNDADRSENIIQSIDAA